MLCVKKSCRGILERRNADLDLHEHINLNSVPLKGRLLLAPISGFTDSPFRRIAGRQGAGLVVSELISAEGIVRNHAKTMELLSFREDERPLAIQIFGGDPGVMAEAARIVEGLGPDVIDLNLGCPAPKVCKSGGGSAMLAFPGQVREVAEKVVAAVNVPVTAKIRLGPEPGIRNSLEVVRALEEGGVSLVTVHGRTRSQRYTGKADWNAIREIRESASVPVVGNGDITSFEEARERMEFSGCPAVMIGRAAVGNPWIFSGRAPGREEVAEQMLAHLDLMMEHYGERGIILMRKHAAKYVHGFRNAAHFRKRLVLCTQKSEFIEIIQELRVQAGGGE